MFLYELIIHNMGGRCNLEIKKKELKLIIELLKNSKASDRELAGRIGVSQPTVSRTRHNLEKKGYITKAPDKARSIHVIQSPSTLSRLKQKMHEVLRTDEGVFHQVVLGLAWTTWQRMPYLKGKMRDRMDRAIVKEAVERGWDILRKEIKPDHIIVIVKTWPTHSPEQTVRRLQSAGRAIKRRYPGAFRGKGLWGKGYAATTSLELLDELTAQLLENQELKKQA